MQRDLLTQGEDPGTDMAEQVAAPVSAPSEAVPEADVAVPRSAEAMFEGRLAALQDMQKQLLDLSPLGGALSPESGSIFSALCVEAAQASLAPALAKAALARRQDPGLGGFARGLAELQLAWEQARVTLAQVGTLVTGGDSEVLRARVDALMQICNTEHMGVILDAVRLPEMSRERSDLEIVQRLQQALREAEVGGDAP